MLAGALADPVFDEAAMEVRAAEANAKSYEGMDWNYAMGWGQQQKEAGHPEDQVTACPLPLDRHLHEQCTCLSAASHDRRCLIIAGWTPRGPGHCLPLGP